MRGSINIGVMHANDDMIARSLQSLETAHKMSSADFLVRYHRGELGDAPEFIEWAGLLWLAGKPDDAGAAMPSDC